MHKYVCVFDSRGVPIKWHRPFELLVAAIEAKVAYSIIIRYYGSIVRLTLVTDSLSKDVPYTEPRIKLGNILICKYVAYIINAKDLYPKMIQAAFQEQRALDVHGSARVCNPGVEELLLRPKDLQFAFCRLHLKPEHATFRMKESGRHYRLGIFSNSFFYANEKSRIRDRLVVICII